MPFGFGLLEIMLILFSLLIPVGAIAAVVYVLVRWDRNRRDVERIERREFMDALEERLARRLGAGHTDDGNHRQM